MNDDLPRIFDFVARADMAGTRTERFRWGTAVFMPECPLRHDSNYLLVEGAPAGLEAADLAAEAERIQGAAGLGHRCVFLRDAALGVRLAPGFAALGWEGFEGAVLAHRRPPEITVGTSLVVETGPGPLRAVREAAILAEPWGTPEVARQLLDAREHIPVPARHFAVFLDGEPVSWAELYTDAGVAQVEAVATREPFRRRGFAGAVVLRAVEEARRGGADLVFLVADARGGPLSLYRRLGFDPVGGYFRFTRV